MLKGTSYSQGWCRHTVLQPQTGHDLSDLSIYLQIDNLLRGAIANRTKNIVSKNR